MSMAEDDPMDAAIGRDSVEIKPWRRMLINYQRAAGGFMMFKGLIGWAIICGIGFGTPFQQLPIEAKGATVFFAVIDVVAGVALWLGSTWGATLWLIVAAAQISADIAFSEIAGLLVLFTILETLLIAGYVLVRFKVYEEEHT
ncbi:MAG: hypothetical protein KF794_07725 [Xanthobacteraceae bacterium]|nr:hypothetical protein [Xanthobacteraceae bacterium]QYK43705.1 MAG: hypothetical protein KF794_07725 [Xanthobacteraceae bacterium]